MPGPDRDVDSHTSRTDAADAPPNNTAPNNTALPDTALLDTVRAEIGGLSDDGIAKEILDLEAQVNALRARQLLALADLDDRHRRNGPGRSGPAATARVGTWLAGETRLAERACVGRVNTGHDLAELPLTTAAFLAGAIGEAHVAKILSVFRKHPDDAREGEATIVGWALGLQRPDFCSAIGALLLFLDREDPAEQAIKNWNRRGLSVTRHDGRVTVIFETTEEAWAQIASRIEPIADELADADWAEAKEIHGDDTTWAHTGRTHSQRLHDALLIHNRRRGDDDRSTSFEVGLVMDQATFDRETDRWASGTVPSVDLDEALARATAHRSQDDLGADLNPAVAWRAAVAGHVRRFVFHLHDAGVDVSRKGRFLRGLQRKAVEVRDRWCVTPGCATPAHRCEIDHVVPFSRGGPSVTANGEARCRRCHQWKTMLDVLGFP